MKVGSFKKIFNNATQNEVFLYLLLVAAVFNLLAYLQNNNLVAVVIFLVIGYVTTLYTKNMSIVLLAAIIVTNLLVCMGYLKNLSLQEGLENNGPDSEEDSEKDSEEDSEEDDEPTKPTKPTKPIKSKTKNQSLNDPKKLNIKESVKIVTSDSVAGDATQTNHKCKSADQHWDFRTNECVSNTVNNENKKNSNKKISASDLTEENIPLDGKPSLNYKATVDTAFDQLGQILGKDGLDKMSLDTDKLANKQDQLIQAMNKMEPMMNTAKSMVESLGGLDLGNLLGGNFMGGTSKN